jgi:hypothetical protein
VSTKAIITGSDTVKALISPVKATKTERVFYMKALMCVVLGVLIFFHAFAPAQAKTILISDIDDTIKNSHVLDKSDALFNAGKTANLVLGMNAVYRAVKAQDASLKFFYVSNAPKAIMESRHRRFLSLNKFPAGSLRLRDSLFQNDFKITEIRKILKMDRPDTVILSGDNGEKDIFVYAQMKKEYPQIRFLTYIHLAYSRLNQIDRGAVMAPGQVGFVTSLDLILQLRKEGFVSNPDTVSFVKGFTTVFAQEDDMSEDGIVAIPVWSDCRDFTWTAPNVDFVLSRAYLDAKNRILERCQINPSAD